MADKPAGKYGQCAICGEDAPLVMDHDHKTAKVRGLICNRCNHGIGWFRDDPKHLLSALAYLLNPPGVVGMPYYRSDANMPEHLRLRKRNHTGCIRVRPDGRWEARIMFKYRRLSFYGKTREEAEAKLEAFRQQCGIISTIAA